MLQTISIIISGKVQGVFYRRSSLEKARETGITGYAENLPDKTVHIIATGTAAQLEEFKTWCRTGPPRAVVTEITVSILPLQTFELFYINR